MSSGCGWRCIATLILSGETVVDYRVGIDQIGSRISATKYCECSLQIQRNFVACNFVDGYPKPSVMRHGIADKYAHLGDFFLATGAQFEAAGAYLRAVWQQPFAVARYAKLVRAVTPNILASRLKRVLSQLSHAPRDESGVPIDLRPSKERQQQ